VGLKLTLKIYGFFYPIPNAFAKCFTNRAYETDYFQNLKLCNIVFQIKQKKGSTEAEPPLHPDNKQQWLDVLLKQSTHSAFPCFIIRFRC